MKMYNNFNELWTNSTMDLIENGEKASPRGQEIKEIIPYHMGLKNPRQRFIFNPARKMSPFYMAAELMWYLAGDNTLDFISYYTKNWNNLTDDGTTLNSAYGHRIFSGKNPAIDFNQYEYVKSILKKDPDSRQAIIHLNTPTNKKSKDIVCTLNLQFFIRKNKLYMHTTMRSNDAVFGTTFDIYFFTLLQEMLAVELDVELGEYYHTNGSYHVYERHYEMIQKASDQQIKGEYTKIYKEIKMPKEFIKEIPALLEIEKQIRTGKEIDLETVYNNLSKYSRNFIHILMIYRILQNNNKESAKEYYIAHENDLYEPHKALLLPYLE